MNVVLQLLLAELPLVLLSVAEFLQFVFEHQVVVLKFLFEPANLELVPLVKLSLLLP